MDNITMDFRQLSFDSRPNYSMVTPPITVTRDTRTPRSRSRNRQCIPSDDEEEEEEESDHHSSEDERTPKIIRASTPTKHIRKSRPLPSDDEDSEDEEVLAKTQRKVEYDPYEDDDDRALVDPALTLVEGSHLQQLHQMQQYHQAQLAQFQYHHQVIPQSSLRPMHAPTQRISMSGMDLLKQLEQEKADLKRQKPRLDTSKVKIEGLLGNLPEPGSHNISFQQIQQQNRKKRGYTKSPYLK
ncbi:hypothetical protein BDB01DRAFT_810418 [Pilobolus umbonatus]|nr:hypothetical protein BDB01DRAFT_810418 [Pilobolus umbonatus]